MGKIYYKNQEYTGSNGGGGGDVPSSAIPTANTISKFDNSAKMNSTDMTSTEITNLVNSLDTQGANLADYVVEQGVSGDWTYRKWASGIAECWGVFSLTCAITTSSSAFFGYRSDAQTKAFPSSLFISTPTVNVINADSSGAIIDNTSGTSSTNLSVWFASSTSRASSSRPINAYAIGRWK